MFVFTRKKIKDFSIYGFGQAVNLLSPLLVMPYLVTVCGEEGIGKIGVGFCTAMILNSIVDYSSYITGVKEISVNRDNMGYVVERAKIIYVAKFLLLLLIALLFSAVFMFIPFFSGDKGLFFLSLTIVAGQFINPAWFFQGTENYKGITVVTVLSRLLYVAGVFIFIKNAEDYIWANFFFGLGTFIAGAGGVVYIMYKYKVSLHGFSVKEAVLYLKEEFTFSMSQVFLSVYQYIPVIIISYVIGNFSAGQYRIIDQVLNIIKSYLNIFFYFVFANVCYELSLDLKKGMAVWKQYNLFNFIMLFCLMAGLFIKAEAVLHFFKTNPATMQQTVTYFRMALAVPFLISISLPLRQLMFAFEKNRVYVAITMVSAVVNVLLLLLLTKFYGLTGSFLSIILIEFIIIVLYVIILRNHFKHNRDNVVKSI